MVSGKQTKKAETQIFSHRLSTVRELRKIPGSQVSYILMYADSAAAFEPCSADSDVVFEEFIIYADSAAVFE